MRIRALAHGILKHLKSMLGTEKEMRRGGLSKLQQLRISHEYDITWQENRRLLKRRTRDEV